MEEAVQSTELPPIGGSCIGDNVNKADVLDTDALSTPDQYARVALWVHTKSRQLCKPLPFESNRPNSSVQSLLRSNKYLFNKFSSVGPPKELNGHPPRLTFFTGGTGCFPESFWGEILVRRTQDVQKGVITFENEMCYGHEGIKFFVELDYRQNIIVGKEIMLRDAKVCCDVLKNFFPSVTNTSYWVLTCTPKLKYKKDNPKPLIACGCHVIFPYVTVTNEQGWEITEEIAELLRVPFAPVDNPYGGKIASLRPMLSRKIVECPDCLMCDALKGNCRFCRGRGKVISGSVYTPSFYFNKEGHQALAEQPEDYRRFLETNLVNVVRETSIFPITAFTPGYNRPHGYVKNIRQNPEALQAFNVLQSEVAGNSDLKMSGTQKVNVLVTRLLREYHTNYDCPTFSVAGIRVDKTGKRNRLFVKPKGSGRFFCRIHNADGADHTSNTIFFIITKDPPSVVQHCYKESCRQAMRTNPIVRLRLTRSLHDKLHVMKQIFSSASVQT